MAAGRGCAVTNRAESAADLPPLGDSAAADAIVQRIAWAGIVGMGGGGFPAAEKMRLAMAAKADFVIGNGMSGQADAHADRTLLQRHFVEVVGGLEVVRQCLPHARGVLAVPSGSAFPSPAMEAGAGHAAGDERSLAARLAQRVVPVDGYPTDVGVVVFNVATLFAVFEAVRRGRRPRRRLATVAGEDRWLAFGTSLAELGLGAGELRTGGALTGVAVSSSAVVEPTTFAVSAPRPASLACIRCQRCEPACPEGLDPQALHDAFEAGAECGAVFDCIECGACTAACPSGIDLVNEFRGLKERTYRRHRRQTQAAFARRRWERRQQRLARQAKSQAQRRSRRLRQQPQW